MGLLIVFEGVDRSGKSSQIQLLHDFLHTKFPTKSVHRLSFPERSTPIGKLIDDFLKSKTQLNDQAIHLLFSANRWELKHVIEGYLKNPNAIVLVDRYFYSGIAYSVAKGLDVVWCAAADKGLPVPDAVFYLDADPQAISTRCGYGDERFERVAFQNRVREAFNDFKRLSMWCTIDVTEASIETTFERIKNIVLDTLVKDE